MKSYLVSAAAIAIAVPAAPVLTQAAAQQPDPAGQPAVADTNGTGGGSDAGASAAADPTPGSAKAAHPDEDQAIVITGTRRPAGDVLGGVAVVDKEELAHDLKPSLGD